MIRPTQLVTLLGLVSGMLLVLIAPAMAEVEDAPAGPGVRVEHVELDPDGTSRFTMSVSGLEGGAALSGDDVTVVENGVGVSLLSVGPVTGEPSEVQPATVLAMDVSGSTEGEPLAAAVAAATTLTEVLRADNVLTGLISFGPKVQTLARLDQPASTVTDALQSLRARGGTSLYDAVARGARLLVEHDGPRDLVVFSDGVDTTSSAGLASARDLAVEAEVRVTTVVLDTGDMDLAPLRAIAEATDGRVIRVTDPDELLAVFEAVAADLTNRYVVEWVVEPTPAPPSQLSLTVDVATPAGVVRDELVVLNPRVPTVTPPIEYEPAAPPIPLLANPVGLATGAVATFLAVAILAGLAFGGVNDRRRREQLASRLETWDGLGDAPAEAAEAAASLSSRAADVVGRMPKPSGMDERLARLLERADWPMRPSEFQLLTIATVLGGLVVPLVLLRSFPLAIMGLMAGAVGPIVWLRMAVARRAAAFEDQLPTVLTLLAGALRAGHAFTTALEGAVRESGEPARSELRRASVEHRLGRDIGESLRGVAERLDSSDLRWVVNAIEIQQDVGGNLAELLDNVAATLRDRASLVRTVKALAAEGRYSAWIIGALPGVMFVLMLMINPDYISFLYSDPRGIAMLVAGGTLMVIGAFILKKLVEPRF